MIQMHNKDNNWPLDIKAWEKKSEVLSHQEPMRVISM